MASYTISYTATTITFRATGLTAGDEIWFFVRPDPDDHTVDLLRVPAYCPAAL